MDEEKNIFEQDIETPVEENVAQEVIEEVAETVDAVSEEFDGEIVEEIAEEVKKSSGSKVAVFSVIITVIVMLILAFVGYKFVLNQYNTNCKYAMTIADVAEQEGKSLADFKAEYGLPANMPGSTYVAIAEYYIPLTYIAEQNGITVDEYLSQMQAMYGLTDEDMQAIDKEKAVIGDVELVVTEAMAKQAEEATPEPISQDEAEAVTRAILGDEIVDEAQAESEGTGEIMTPDPEAEPVSPEVAAENAKEKINEMVQ